jgi:FMN-dependent NADH-azoreductase
LKSKIMAKILVIKSSILGANSASSAMADAFLSSATSKKPNTTYTVRDLGAAALPHLSAEVLGQMRSDAPEVSRQAAQGKQALAELLGADTLVLAIPMYNFSIPSSLKAWFDHVLHPGQTFEYTSAGPRGLLSGKKGVLLISSGGDYSAAPASSMDFVEPYVRTLMGFMGITDVTVIKADGGATGEAGAAKKAAAFAAIAAL